MPEGVDVEVMNGYAYITFPDPSKQGPALAALLAIGTPISVDTSGRRTRGYRVPEGNAREVGLIDMSAPPASAPEPPAPEPPVEKPAPSPARKRARAKTEEPDSHGAHQVDQEAAAPSKRGAEALPASSAQNSGG